MKIIESFTQGKTGREDVNEDRIVVTGDFIAVLDGVTSKNCPKVEGKAGGRFAVELGQKEIESFPADIAPRTAVDRLTAALRAGIDAHLDLPPLAEGPAFGIILYSRARREVFRVSDPAMMADGALYLNDKDIDIIAAAARALMIETALQKGATVESIMREDAGRAFILPLLAQQQVFANRVGGYGYGIINGTPVPDKLLQVFSVPGTREIVLALDGYPEIFPTLAESENRLAEILKEDPLMFRRHKSTKGVQAGNVSFDDRAYIRFETGEKK